MKGGVTMELVGKALDYIQNTANIKMLNSNFLISDLNKIIYTTMINHIDCDYLDKLLSHDMQELITEWSNKTYSEDLFIVLNDNYKQIIENDSTNYSAQMFFPIFIDNKLQGFTIFFRIQGNYIASSSKAPRTVTGFLQKLLNDKSNSQKENPMIKSEEVSKYFENYLFSEIDLDYVWEKVDNNLATLLGVTEYLDNEQKLTRLNKELVSSLNEQQRKILNEYKKTAVASRNYEYCLAYYLGQKSIIEANKLK